MGGGQTAPQTVKRQATEHGGRKGWPLPLTPVCGEEAPGTCQQTFIQSDLASSFRSAACQLWATYTSELRLLTGKQGQ